MLKKVTLVSAIVMVAAFLAGLVLVPMAIKDALENGERLAERFFSSSDISVYDAAQYDAVQVDIPEADIYIEQSGDNNIYLRVEGYKADQYALISKELEADGARTISLGLDRDALFFGNPHSSYMLKLGFLRNTYHVVVLRVPAGVAVTTTGPNWRVNYDSNVVFKNKSFYDNREWEARQEGHDSAPTETIEGDAGTLLEKYTTMSTVFSSDMDTLIAKLYTGDGRDVAAMERQVDELVNSHFDRMISQLFPAASEVYDMQTLTTLLRNYLDLYGQQVKQQARVDMGEYGGQGERYDTAAANAAHLLQLAQQAQSTFEEMYQNYLATAQFAEGLPLVANSEEPQYAPPASSQPVPDAVSQVEITPGESPSSLG